MNIKTIKVSQPLGEFYIAKIKAGDLLKISTSSVLRYKKDGTLEGHQRPLDSKRLKAIANFIMSSEMSFPTSILIAANINPKGEIIEDNTKRWQLIKTDLPDVFECKIPEDGISSLIIDGQHRLNAFEDSSCDPGCKDIELVCSIFFDLPNPYQAYLFATINGTQKKVDKSQALELFGYDIENEPQDTWSPEKLAVYLSRKLNFTSDSPLYQKIKLAPLHSELGEIVDKAKWIVSTAAIVEGILSLISKNPQKDRDSLAMKRNSLWGEKSRKLLAENKDNSVLRTKYIECKDDEIYNIIFEFFSSVNQILWHNAQSNSIIIKPLGISVLFDILKTILETDGRPDSYDMYINKISDVNYTDNYFSLSGGGKTRLKRILKYKMGYLSYEGLTEDEKKYLNN